MMGQMGLFAEYGRTVLNFDRQNCVPVGMTLNLIERLLDNFQVQHSCLEKVF